LDPGCEGLVLLGDCGADEVGRCRYQKKKKRMKMTNYPSRWAPICRELKWGRGGLILSEFEVWSAEK
jgi:hypothetical protein